MPANHFLLIPLVLVVGVVIGWRLGARTVRREWEKAEKLRREREEA